MSVDFSVFAKIHAVTPSLATFLQQLNVDVGSDHFGVLAQSSRMLRIANLAPNVRRCEWSMQLFEETYPRFGQIFRSLSRKKQEAHGHRWNAARFATYAPVMLYHRRVLNGSCNAVVRTKYVWILESDALFHGNAYREFFLPLNAVASDLLSTGYSAATRDNWWAYSLNSGHVSPQPNLHLPGFGCLYSETRCTPHACNFGLAKRRCPTTKFESAYVMRMIMVERFSDALLNHTHAFLEQGQGMIGEAFESTLCFQAPWCRALDWQDHVPESPFYMFNPAPVDMSQATCKRKHVWLHPVLGLKSWVDADACAPFHLLTEMVRQNAKTLMKKMHPHPPFGRRTQKAFLSSQSCSPYLPPHLIHDYPKQDVQGPIQADESMLLHALLRTSGASRALELGGLQGHSASVFLHAMKCQPEYKMYTVDLNPVANQDPRHHKTLQKDAKFLTPDDIDHEPIDVLFLDCHAFYATQQTILNLLNRNMLRKNGLIVLHDTGKNHNPKLWWAQDGIHQPVERLVAQWLSHRQSDTWQRISIHDDDRTGGGRHGITIMQRRANLKTPCTNWKQHFDVQTARECKEAQTRPW